MLPAVIGAQSGETKCGFVVSPSDIAEVDKHEDMFLEWNVGGDTRWVGFNSRCFNTRSYARNFRYTRHQAAWFVLHRRSGRRFVNHYQPLSTTLNTVSRTGSFQIAILCWSSFQICNLGRPHSCSRTTDTLACRLIYNTQPHASSSPHQ